jgi:hypothetical protein
MQTPLSQEEKDIVLQLLNLQHDAELQSELAAFAADSTQSFSQGARQALLVNAQILASNGLHHLALEAYGVLLMEEAEPSLLVSLAVSAWLSDDSDFAQVWAQRAYTRMVIDASREGDGQPMGEYGLVAGWRLTKLYRLLGKEAEVDALRALLSPLLPLLEGRSEYLLLVLRMMVELGFEQEINQVLHLLPTICLGMGSGGVVGDVVRTCFAHGRFHTVWALVGMADTEIGRGTFEITAIDEAIAMGRYDWALKFASCQGNVEDDWCGLAHFGKSLVRQGRTTDWKSVWNQARHGRAAHFDTSDQLRFLSVMAEHCNHMERMEVLTYTHEQEALAAQAHSQIFKEQIRALCFVIYAWLEDENVVQAMFPTVALPRHTVRLVMRAGFVRRYEFLAQAAFSMLTPALPPGRTSPLQLEIERRKAGQEDQAMAVFEALRAEAFATADRELIDSLAGIAATSLKDTALYFALREECQQKQIPLPGSVQLALRFAARSGNLIELAHWIRLAGMWRADEFRLGTLLDLCLEARSDFSGRMAGF